MTKISIIIRTLNEERWIGKCLENVADQSIDELEVVLVDNLSTDKTVEKAKNVYPDLSLVQIDNYRPGLALNEGIRKSSGEFFVCLSAHCIPVTEEWLENLYNNFEDYSDVAGVYGRQIPTKSSTPVDKRDLIRTFGPEKRVQTKDSFFHNANSIIKREVWNDHPFDEDVTNIEDQIWASEVLNEGYKIIYEPESVVYHYHGINQSNDPHRTQSVVETMENNLIEEESHISKQFGNTPLDPNDVDIVAILPLRQQSHTGVDTNEMLIAETLEDLQESEYTNDIIISTDAEYIADQAVEWGASESIIRPSELSQPDVMVDQVFKYTLEKIEDRNRYPDLLLTLDITHPFRPDGLLDDIIEYTLHEGVDCTIPVYPEHRPSWLKSDGDIDRLNQKAVRENRTPINIGLNGIGVVTYPDNVRKGSRVSGDIGLYPVENPLATVEVRNRDDLKYWEVLEDMWERIKDHT